MKQNDKSSFTGLILMAAILIIFNVFVFDNTSEQVDYKDNIEQVNSNQQNSKEENIIDTSIDIDTTGVLKEKFYTLENDKIKLEFTNKGGEISSAVIKGYYSYQEYKKNLDDETYESKDIEIFNNKDSKFEITGDRNINTNELFLVEEDNNSISFRKNYDNNAYIKYTYTLDQNKSYFVDLSIESEGISNPELIWTIAAPETEKSKTNPQHFAPLYNEYYESIFRYVIKRINDTDLACDITSNVFVKAITNLSKYEYRGLPFSSWLFRIAKSEVYQSFRDQKVKRTVSIDKVTIVQVFEELDVDGLDEHKEKLKKVLRQINEKDLMLIEMRYFEKRSYREIGEILSVTENNAKVKTFRALQKLKVLFKE